MKIAVAVAAMLMLAGAAVSVRLIAGGGLPWAGTGAESGYSPPDTMVLVSADGRTLYAGYSTCVEHGTLQATERPGSVTLRVYWHDDAGFTCFPPGVGVALARPSLNHLVRLASPLGGRRLEGPDGEVLPWLNQAAMLTIPSPPASRQYGDPALALPFPVWGRLVPTTRCLQSPGSNGSLMLEQCAHGGTRPAVPPAGAPVTVRGRAGHLLDSGQQAARALAGYGFPWRELWWVQDDTVVILVSQGVVPADPSPLSAARLVALAGRLSCPRPASCR